MVQMLSEVLITLLSQDGVSVLFV